MSNIGNVSSPLLLAISVSAEESEDFASLWPYHALRPVWNSVALNQGAMVNRLHSHVIRFLIWDQLRTRCLWCFPSSGPSGILAPLHLQERLLCIPGVVGRSFSLFRQDGYAACVMISSLIRSYCLRTSAPHSIDEHWPSHAPAAYPYNSLQSVYLMILIQKSSAVLSCHWYHDCLSSISGVQSLAFPSHW